MKYDLKAMDFDVGEARAALEDLERIHEAFIWSQTPEGGDFWCYVWLEDVPTSEWHPKVKAMIAQWEAENGEGDKPAVTVNMSLRDWFAGKALASLIRGEDYDPEGWSQAAYEYADAMMAERKKGGAS